MGRWGKSSPPTQTGDPSECGLKEHQGDPSACGLKEHQEEPWQDHIDVSESTLCEELREQLSQQPVLLLSRSADLLSPDARRFLKSSGISFKAFVGRHRDEFKLELRLDGAYVSLLSHDTGRETGNEAIAGVDPERLGRRWGKKLDMEPRLDAPARSTCSSGAAGRSVQRNARRQQQRRRAREEVQRLRAHEVCLVWLRDDLRLHDNPALLAAADSGRAVIPLFIHDATDPSPWPTRGAALWWKHRSLEAFSNSLSEHCRSNLTIRCGAAIEVLQVMCEETSASHVYFNRQVEPWYRDRDLKATAALTSMSVIVESFKAVVLAEPWERHKGRRLEESVHRAGDAVHLRARLDHARPKGLYEADETVAHQDDGRIAADCSPVPSVAGRCLAKPCHWPSSIPLGELGYGRTTGFGFPKGFQQFRCASESLVQTAVPPALLPLKSIASATQGQRGHDWALHMSEEWHVGEDAALKRLHEFIRSVLEQGLHERPHRCRADEKWTSVLSPYIRFGELSPRTCYAEALKCNLHKRKPFVRRLFWRDLAYAELFRWPELPSVSVRKQYEAQRWSGTQAQLRRWQRGQTGFPLVDAAMRQLWQIGWLPNYMRHVTAQFLIEFLDLSWKQGFLWYDYTLLDADVAINAHMWQNGGHSGISQWYFLLHPVAAAKQADPHGHYVRRWVPELAGLPSDFIHCPWEAPVGLRSSLLLRSSPEYHERIIQDLSTAIRRHVLQVIELRKKNMHLVNKEGYDMLQLPNGRHVRLGTREDFRLFDEAAIPFVNLPMQQPQQSLLSPAVVGTQNALLEEEIRRSVGGSDSFASELDIL